MQRKREESPFFWRLHPELLGFKSGTAHTVPVNPHSVEVTRTCFSSLQPETSTAKA